MNGYLIAGLLGAGGGITLALLDQMTNRTLATVLGLTVLALSLLALAKWGK